jgi:hypothetical protein
MIFIPNFTKYSKYSKADKGRYKDTNSKVISKDPFLFFQNKNSRPEGNVDLESLADLQILSTMEHGKVVFVMPSLCMNSLCTYKHTCIHTQGHSLALVL